MEAESKELQDLKEEFKECKVCPVCQVRIVESTRGVAGEVDTPVLFSHGKPGTKGRLWARVCQYIQNHPDKYPHCLNKDFILNPDSVILMKDFFFGP